MSRKPKDLVDLVTTSRTVLSNFAKAKTASGYVLEMGTKEEPWCRLLPPFGAGAKVVGNPTELVLATIGKGLMKIAVSGRD